MHQVLEARVVGSQERIDIDPLQPDRGRVTQCVPADIDTGGAAEGPTIERCAQFFQGKDSAGVRALRPGYAAESEIVIGPRTDNPGAGRTVNEIVPKLMVRPIASCTLAAMSGACGFQVAMAL
ncbi:MAG: hypothetical protein AUH92_00610 [Acidobacteria bacterium 13_1_40CM_4_69_4]|nr:MAG: hypothetical protein AUH92_00610 [Acidobacteria bacterium 13_1_40CM_4_69_4]